jgi:hypothetical protein
MSAVKTYRCASPEEIIEKAGDASGALMFAFVSSKQDVRETADVLKRSGGRAIGCTTAGEIIGDENGASAHDGSIVVAEFRLDPNAYDAKIFTLDGEDFEALGARAGMWASERFANPVVVAFIGGDEVDGDGFLEAARSAADGELRIYGGLAGDDGAFQRTFVFDENRVVDNGAAVAVFDGDAIEVDGVSSCGWTGLGVDLTATKTEKNVLYEIDGEPALDVFLRYLGASEDEMPGIGVDHPFLVTRENGEEIIRVALGFDPKRRSLTLAGSVKEGSRVRMTASAGAEVIDVAKRDLDMFDQRFRVSDFTLVFSCFARREALGPLVDQEINHVAALRRAPLAGFFTYGEFGKGAKGASEFYNETFTVASLRFAKGDDA